MERSSTLFLAISNASFDCSAEKTCAGISRLICSPRVTLDSEADTDLGGVKIGAKLSLSRPGNRMPLDLKL